MTIDGFIQFSNISFFSSKHVHEAFGRVAVNFIVDRRLQICRGAVERFEFQVVQSSQGKLQFNHTPTRHRGIGVRFVEVPARYASMASKHDSAFALVDDFLFRSRRLGAFGYKSYEC
jgi:hypothetical protein